jgi:uncharacterized protein YndB with AHSA1/START domain
LRIGGVVRVTRQIEVPSPPEEVWTALTDPGELEEWFASEVELEPVPGGAGVFRWGDGEERRAVVEEVDEERRFAFTWEGARVSIELEPIPDGTRVTVVEEPTAGWTAAFELRAMAAVALA